MIEVTTKKASDLKTRRVKAGITRKVAAEAAGISQFKLDKIERGVDVSDDVRKAYDAGMAKLLAESAKTQPGAKKQAAKSTMSKPGTRTHKAAQPKPKTEESAA
ncbi:MAG TPA: helix-turn-helix transcriptional regulator [Jiangellaceae bacterium]|nr:helix-turn-helix transcriptional regulator [Jiangellaceae bacterium]